MLKDIKCCTMREPERKERVFSRSLGQACPARRSGDLFHRRVASWHWLVEQRRKADEKKWAHPHNTYHRCPDTSSASSRTCKERDHRAYYVDTMDMITSPPSFRGGKKSSWSSWMVTLMIGLNCPTQLQTISLALALSIHNKQTIGQLSNSLTLTISHNT